MSLAKVQANIGEATADGHLSAQEAQKILSTKDRPVFGGASDKNIDSLGDFIDADEFRVVSSLNQSVVDGRLSADSGAKALLDGFVQRGGPDSMLTNALTKGTLTGATSIALFFSVAPPMWVIAGFGGLGMAIGAASAVMLDD